MKTIREAELVALIRAGTRVDCELVPQKDGEFKVEIIADDKKFSLMSFRGEERTYADPRYAFSWAKRTGLKSVRLNVDLHRWPKS